MGGAALDDEIGYYYIVTGNPKKVLLEKIGLDQIKMQIVLLHLT